jgi:hypothetical protein
MLLRHYPSNKNIGDGFNRCKKVNTTYVYYFMYTCIKHLHVMMYFTFLLLVTLILSLTAKPLFESDILIGPEQLRLVYGSVTADALIKSGAFDFRKDHENLNNRVDRRRLALLGIPELLWSVRNGDDKIILPWEFKEASLYSTGQRDTLANHMAAFEANIGVISFVPRTTETDYVRIEYSDMCASWVGRVGGMQEMYLHPNCLTQGTVSHEWLHVLGYFHEHSRTDRDDYVTINEENVIPEALGNFNKRSAANTDDLGIGYDYSSVMHYGAYDFSISPGVLKTIDSGVNAIGSDFMSEMDIKQARLLYKCLDGPRQNLDFCSDDCLCEEDEGHCISDTGCEGELFCTNNVCSTVNTPTVPTASTPRPTVRGTFNGVNGDVNIQKIAAAVAATLLGIFVIATIVSISVWRKKSVSGGYGIVEGNETSKVEQVDPSVF